MVWPSVAYVDRYWTPSVDEGYSRREIRRQTGSFRSAVVPRIANEDVLLPAATIAHCEDAAAGLASCRTLVEARGTRLPLTLLRSEAASSSQIERITVGVRALREAELGLGTSSNAESVIGNVRALKRAIRAADDLDEDAILAAHAELFRASWPEIAGAWRDRQVWIGPGSAGPRLADFVPPDHRDVPAAMSDLVAFVRRTDLPMVAQAAIAHAQFETIHPFVDGNGRIGRAMIFAMLFGPDGLRHSAIPVSSGLLADTAGYFDALQRYRQGDIVPIVDSLAGAIEHATVRVRRLLVRLDELRAGWKRDIHVRADSTVWKVLDLLESHPVVDSQLIAERLSITSANAVRALDRLESEGILLESSGRRRGRVWRSPDVLEAFEEFTSDVDRRRLPD